MFLQTVWGKVVRRLQRGSLRTAEAWKHVHQPFELAYHRDYGIRWCSDEAQFRSLWNEVFAFAQLAPHGHSKRKLLDIGTGPRPPLKTYAPDDELVVIEPLADKYRELTPEDWWKRITVYSQPAEHFLHELFNEMDFVLCWNCLDHTIGWKAILANAWGYMRNDGIFALATDFKKPFVGHPGFPRGEFRRELGKLFEIIDERDSFKDRDIALLLRKKA